MTKEEIYDAEIAPMLLAACKRCQELGFPMVASVDPGETGRTEFSPSHKGDTRPSAKQLLVHYAARFNGNIDAMLIQVVRDANEFGHGSAYIQMLGCKPADPKFSSGAVAIMVIGAK